MLLLNNCSLNSRRRGRGVAATLPPPFLISVGQKGTLSPICLTCGREGLRQSGKSPLPFFSRTGTMPPSATITAAAPTSPQDKSPPPKKNTGGFVSLLLSSNSQLMVTLKDFQWQRGSAFACLYYSDSGIHWWSPIQILTRVDHS